MEISRRFNIDSLTGRNYRTSVHSRTINGQLYNFIRTTRRGTDECVMLVVNNGVKTVHSFVHF